MATKNRGGKGTALPASKGGNKAKAPLQKTAGAAAGRTSKSGSPSRKSK